MLLFFRFILIILAVMTLEGCVRAHYNDYPRSKTYYIQPSYDRGYGSSHQYYASPERNYHSDRRPTQYHSYTN